MGPCLGPEIKATELSEYNIGCILQVKVHTSLRPEACIDLQHEIADYD